MTPVDPELANWEKGERRRSIYLAGSVGFNIVQTIALICVIVVLVDLTNILNRRTPVIEFIRDVEERSECATSIEAAFLTTIGDMVLNSEAGEEERASILANLRVTSEAIASLQDSSTNPCDIVIPVERGE